MKKNKKPKKSISGIEFESVKVRVKIEKVKGI